MNYFKTSLIILAILMISSTVFAYESEWESIGSQPLKEYPAHDVSVMLDLNSVNKHNDSLYYSVLYRKSGNVCDKVAIIQSKNGKAGVVTSYTKSDYHRLSTNGNPALTPLIAKNMQELKPDKLIYYADLRAQVVSQPNWDYYVEKVQERVHFHWHPTGFKHSRKAVVLFTIDKNGEVVSNKILNSSGDKNFDSYALDTVQLSAPFEKLPSRFKSDTVDIDFTFEYNVK